MIHYLPGHLMEERIEVVLVGAGGTGGEVLHALVRLHFALLAKGHPYGLDVTVYDGDSVSASNIGRQRFGVHDVGHNKATLLVSRVNAHFNLDWDAVPQHLETGDDLRTNVLVTCVDNATARVNVPYIVEADYWLDFGNGDDSGQVVLGHLDEEGCLENGYLPNVLDLFPELKTIADKEAAGDPSVMDEPSCSLAEALLRQALNINPLMAFSGIELLSKLLFEGRLTHHGAQVNLKSLQVQPIAIDPAVWAFYGYESPSYIDEILIEASEEDLALLGT